jgi:aminodeoxychorismate synthase component I
MARLKTVQIRLDSSLPGARWPLAADLPPPAHVLWCDATSGIARLRSIWGVEREWNDPLGALRWLEERARGGIWPDERWVGFLSYDLGRLFEAGALGAVPRATEDVDVPLFCFASISAQEYHAPAVVESPAPRRAESPPLHSTFTRRAYLDAVTRAIEYIRAGDVFQVNLSQRFTAPLTDPPGQIYRRLLERAPAAYGGLLDFGEFALICNSPELFLRVTPQPDGSRHVITRPIKGTRPRAAGMEQELRQSAKDQAELNMIVDLERNDLGRVCEIGSVKVTEPRVIETHPTVYHGVATIEGILRRDVTFVDLLRAAFPGGSVTGAPKIRAMQIIDELEPVRRGPYCGAIGWLGPDGSMEFNIAIRTMIVQGGRVHIPVGGGIVADSDPAAEYEETLVKARAMFAALRIEPPLPQ